MTRRDKLIPKNIDRVVTLVSKDRHLAVLDIYRSDKTIHIYDVAVVRSTSEMASIKWGAAIQECLRLFDWLTPSSTIVLSEWRIIPKIVYSYQQGSTILGGALACIVIEDLFRQGAIRHTIPTMTSLAIRRQIVDSYSRMYSKHNNEIVVVEDTKYVQDLVVEKRKTEPTFDITAIHCLSPP